MRLCKKNLSAETNLIYDYLNKGNFSNILSKKHTIQKKPLDQTEFLIAIISY